MELCQRQSKEHSRNVTIKFKNKIQAKSHKGFQQNLFNHFYEKKKKMLATFSIITRALNFCLWLENHNYSSNFYSKLPKGTK